MSWRQIETKAIGGEVVKESGRWDIWWVSHRGVEFSLWQEFQWRRYELDAKVLTECSGCDQIDECVNFVGSCNVLPRSISETLQAYHSVLCFWNMLDWLNLDPSPEWHSRSHLNLSWTIPLVQKSPPLKLYQVASADSILWDEKGTCWVNSIQSG